MGRSSSDRDPLLGNRLGWRLGEDPRSDFEALARSLENPRDITDEATRATLEEATEAGRGSSGGVVQRVVRALGGLHGPAEQAGFYRFNLVNRFFTMPLGVAALDWRGARKMQAVLGKIDTAKELSKRYFGALDSWNRAPQEVQDEAYRFLEIATLQGLPVARDGRTLIAENTGEGALKYAAMSKPGALVRLSPEASQLVVDHVSTMDQIWRDLIGEYARREGWTGEPSAAAIYKAAEGATGSEKKVLDRTAKIVAAIEYRAQETYLPLMRSGDYFFRVTPARPSEEWSGEGFPPTTRFDLIDPLTPAERALGGVQRGVPQRVQDRLGALREQFPEGEYDVEHGYAFRDTNVLKEINIPAVDKLMALVGNDARAELRKGFEAAGIDKEEAVKRARSAYNDLVDSVLNQVYEERTAGFRKRREGVPGYDTNFGASTSKYVNWLSNTIADMRHRPDMEAADQLIYGDGTPNSGHPDPRTRQYWRDYDRMTEDLGVSDQVSGPLARIRQGAFGFLLGGNAATSAKVLLHGPARFMPIVGTGLGAQGRARAAGDYLAAHAQLLRGLGIGKSGIEVDLMKGLNEEERGVMQRALDRDIVHEQTADEMALRARQAGDERGMSERERFMRRVFDIWTSNVSAADRMIRGSGLLAAYRTAKREGMEAINKIWDKNQMWAATPDKTPEAFAQFMVRHTIGQWGSVNRMPALRTTFGGMIGQFRSYELGYISNTYNMLVRMGPEGKVTAALMLGGLGMMGGTLALPFAKDAETAAETVWGWVSGLAPNLSEDLENAMNALFGEPQWAQTRSAVGEALTHGPARQITGIDWSSLGFGDLLSRNMQSPLDLLGAAMSTFIGAPQRAVERYKSGQDPLSVLTELMPTGVKAMIHAYAPETALASAKTGTPVLSPDQLSTADRLKMAANFRPAQTAERYEDIQRTSHLHDRYTHAITQAENKIANLMHRGDTEGASAAMGQARQLVAEAIRKGGFSQAEIATFNRQLRQAIMRREHPEVPSKTQQRVNAGESRP